jgi:hypothetical protein
LYANVSITILEIKGQKQGIGIFSEADIFKFNLRDSREFRLIETTRSKGH